ncbi:MAG: biotin/lipoyl-containing protein [bacterium]
MIYDFIHNDEICQVDIENRNSTLTAKIEDTLYELELEPTAPQVLSLIIDNNSYKVTYASNGNELYVHIRGEVFKFQIPDEDEDISELAEGEAGDQDLFIKSTMPGSILKIEVKEGDKVEEGQCLVIVEAMKMETGLHSTISGKVKKICTESGKQINSGEVLIELEKSE